MMNLQQSHYSVPAFGSLNPYTSVVIPIGNLFNNQAASQRGYVADFDGQGSSYDGTYLPMGCWVYDGISYDLPSSWGLREDNILADGQVISLPVPTRVHEIHLMYARDGADVDVDTNFELTFGDNSTEIVSLSAKNWWTWTAGLNVGAIESPYHFERHGLTRNWNSTHIFQWSSSISSRADLQSITLPRTISSWSRLHIFAISMSLSSASSSVDVPVLAVRRARFTMKWEDIDGVRAQVVEVTLANLSPQSAFSRHTSINAQHEIHLVGPGLSTVRPGIIQRLVASDQVRVDVLVLAPAASGNATVQLKGPGGDILSDSGGWPIIPLRETWTPDAKVLGTHETPRWWDEAKFGIFIHWGPYSVPAWAPPHQYAAWYDWHLHMPNNPTALYHEKTFGKDLLYDDFIANFTAAKFNASEWLGLFDGAGAKYFVFVTKHHDGYALFDTGNTTHRNSLLLGPKRDFLEELFTTAKREKPSMRRGAYYSLPEWFSPDYAPYGFVGWPGGLAHSVFNTSQVESYTGRVDINDYITDLQLPHMLDLVEKYDAEIMWCDIGGPNSTLEFASRFYNHAARNGRQVTINNRCGTVPDYDTPEYRKFGATQPRKWESSEGIDPYTYAYNSATAPHEYKNATRIIHTLVDVVSKNGNYLLGVGPNAEGEIVEPTVTNLLNAGKWLKYSGNCIYGTDYWFQGSQDTSGEISLRFMGTHSTFCIIALSRPTGGQLVVNKRVPILPGDEIRILRPGSEGQDAFTTHGNRSDALPWTIDESTGQLKIDVSDTDLVGVDYAWAFEVQYCCNHPTHSVTFDTPGRYPECDTAGGNNDYE